jgi:hypothetical protein
VKTSSTRVGPVVGVPTIHRVYGIQVCADDGAWHDADAFGHHVDGGWGYGELGFRRADWNRIRVNRKPVAVIMRLAGRVGTDSGAGLSLANSASAFWVKYAGPSIANHSPPLMACQPIQCAAHGLQTCSNY